MKGYLSRRYRLSASHRLHVDAFSDQQNRETFGKCNNPYGHGHNYVVQVTYSGQINAETGMVLDLAALDRFAQDHVLRRFDHTNLNTVEILAEKVPTTENFAIALESLFREFAGAHLEGVYVEGDWKQFVQLLPERVVARGRTVLRKQERHVERRFAGGGRT